MKVRVGLVVAAVAWGPPAKADGTRLGVTYSVNRPTVAVPSSWGVGAEAQLGRRFDLRVGELTAELCAGLQHFDYAGGAWLYRAMAGANLGGGRPLRPSVFGHVGLGHTNGPDAAAERIARPSELTGLAIDMGLALDLALIPFVNVGVWVSGNALTDALGDGSLLWLQTGVQVALVF